MSIGGKIKELRVRKGESLQVLADAVGASKPHIWEIEMGKSKNPSLDLLKKFAEHFEVPISFLLNENPAVDTLIFGREFKNATEEDKKLIWQMAERLMGKESDG